MNPSKKGSAIVWCIIIMMILSILILSLLGMSASFVKRGTDQRDMRQAYFTAKTVAESIANQMVRKTSEGISILTYLGAHKTMELTDIEVSDTMGTCSGKIEYVGRGIQVTVNAAVGRFTDSVTLTLKGTKDSGGEPEREGLPWPEPEEWELFPLNDTVTELGRREMEYHYVPKDTVLGDAAWDIAALGNGSIFIWIEEGATLNLGTIHGGTETLSGDTMMTPNVYIILGKDATLNVNRTERSQEVRLHAFIFGESSGTVNIGQNTMMFGDIFGCRTNMDDTASLTKIVPNDSFIPEDYVWPLEGGTILDYSWGFLKYDK